jgi:hypothetical protein
VWSGTILIVLLIFRYYIKKILSALKQKIDMGAEFKTPWVTIGAVPINLESPKKDEPVTENHMALVHSSWRYPKKDKEFQRPMYCFHALIKAGTDVLDRIEYVTYHLHHSYPEPIQKATQRETQFKLKELAWAESVLKATVKIKGQEEPIILSRYINLTETGSGF